MVILGGLGGRFGGVSPPFLGAFHGDFGWGKGSGSRFGGLGVENEVF